MIQFQIEGIDFGGDIIVSALVIDDEDHDWRLSYMGLMSESELSQTMSDVAHGFDEQTISTVRGRLGFCTYANFEKTKEAPAIVQRLFNVTDNFTTVQDA